ncbi:MAG: OsmC family protein [Actinomycetota bacterium]
MAMEVTAYWDGGMRVRVPVRDFEVRSDEPPRFGGDDTAPMPTELFLSSLATCFVLAVRHVARKDGFEPPDLAVRVEGTYEGLRFGKIRVEVRSSDDRVRDLIDRAVTYCYVSNTLREPPEMEYVMAEDPASHRPPPRPS